MKQLIYSILLCSTALSAQTVVPLFDSRIIATAVPFLQLSTDAYSLGMGEMGVATPPNVFSQQWNAAKYVFANESTGIGLSYAPYLNSLVNDMSLGNVSYFHKSKKRKSAWGASLTYFNAGEFHLSSMQQNQYVAEGVEQPFEFSADVSYSLPLSPHWAMGVTMRYIHSNLSVNNQTERLRVHSFATDIAAYFSSEIIAYNRFWGKYNFGLQIAHLGTKVKYTDLGREFFLPTTLKIGTGYSFIFDNQDNFSIYLEAKKLLVPTPPQYGFVDKNNNGQQDPNEPTTIIAGKNPNISFLSGIFQSFSDAPGGLKEELQEVAYSVGVSYEFEEALLLGAGFYNESEQKGARKFFTLGVGFHKANYHIHLSYLFSVSKIANPFEKGLRISLVLMNL